MPCSVEWEGPKIMLKEQTSKKEKKRKKQATHEWSPTNLITITINSYNTNILGRSELITGPIANQERILNGFPIRFKKVNFRPIWVDLGNSHLK